VSLDDVEVNPVIPQHVAQNLWRLPREVLATGAEDVDLGARASGLRTPRTRSSRPQSARPRDPNDLLGAP